MKQIIQNYKTGEIRLTEVPPPAAKKGWVLVQNLASLVSVGTEKYMLEMAKKSLLGKALARPDLVRQVMAKVKTDGLLEAYRIAMARLDKPTPLGYSSAGVVLAAGDGMGELREGDRVACTGSAYASHAEVISVPQNLAVKIPPSVSFEHASFVALGGIALEAVRMARVSLGETVAVIGLGLLGQIAVQLLRAAGCHVIAMDPDAQKVQGAGHQGAEAATSDSSTLLAIGNERTGNRGTDAVLIFAATPSNEPLERAAELCRERGRIVAAGLVGLEVPRKPFYDKELEFIVSRAWGPGIYDPNYVEKGTDYPFPYARWTAKRNMEEFLLQLAKGAVRVDHLISHRFPIDRSLEAYEMILGGKEPYIGVLLTYPGRPVLEPTTEIQPPAVGTGPRRQKPESKVEASRAPVGIGLIGAGQFTTNTLLPVMRGIEGFHFHGVATSTGISARHTAEKFKFDFCTTESGEIFRHSGIGLVFILTRHGSHARLVQEALRSGKHVFVEKPLCLNKRELQEIINTYSELRTSNSEVPLLMVGFNRRFAPLARWLKEQFKDPAQPLSVHYTVNAGTVPPEHWVHDPEQGGGRITGEVCHFIDLIQYLTGSVPVRVYAETLPSGNFKPSDNVMMTLKMANGAMGNIVYLSSGDKRYPRERVEVFGGGAVGVIENFRRASVIRGGRAKTMRSWFRVDRGHRGEMEALGRAVRTGGPAPVNFEEYVYTTLATFAAEESLRRGRPITVHPAELSEEIQVEELGNFPSGLPDFKEEEITAPCEFS